MVYRNTPSSQTFLSLRNKDTYLGWNLNFCAKRTYQIWGGLTNALRTGKRQTKDDAPLKQHRASNGIDDVSGVEDNLFAHMYGDDRTVTEFVYAMMSVNRLVHDMLTVGIDVGPGEGDFVGDVVVVLDWGRYKTMLDVGGGVGYLACAVAKRHTHMTCVTLDLPCVQREAEAYVRGSLQVCEDARGTVDEPLGKRMRLVSGDFFTNTT